MTSENDRLNEASEYIHVYPEGDFKEHTLSRTCWCVPVEQKEYADTIVIHNALDGRDSNDITTRQHT